MMQVDLERSILSGGAKDIAFTRIDDIVKTASTMTCQVIPPPPGLMRLMVGYIVVLVIRLESHKRRAGDQETGTGI